MLGNAYAGGAGVMFVSVGERGCIMIFCDVE